MVTFVEKSVGNKSRRLRQLSSSMCDCLFERGHRNVDPLLFYCCFTVVPTLKRHWLNVSGVGTSQHALHILFTSLLCVYLTLYLTVMKAFPVREKHRFSGGIRKLPVRHSNTHTPGGGKLPVLLRRWANAGSMSAHRLRCLLRELVEYRTTLAMDQH